ncbi:MAG: HlyD family efflux transporter periplasmic adaptor subunit [Colwellia sp.]|uniref:HlyD family secretion protein n=1 Tax=Colwellia sp. TaxID=56799 RepID=UPI0025BB0306|nr:HlyD family efflux transporter periplasmic adaptor subunit [Colwellia sp.]NQZ25705.1 HlyD family efflux transporter periplasmic adaptor subunit [Colwellia sp.]
MDIQNMDIKKTAPVKKNLWQKPAVFIVAALAFTAWQFNKPSSDDSVARSELSIATVQQSDLAFTISGFGKLISKHKRLLTAPTKATVEEILLLPGTQVTPDTVIMKLSNPDLLLQVNNAQMELARHHASLRELIINQKSDYLAHQAILIQIKANLAAAELKVEAQASLAEKGIVSSLDFKRSKLAATQFAERLNIEQQRLAHLKSAHQEKIAVQGELAKQLNANLVLKRSLQADLVIHADIEGVLQSMPVTLGQSVTAGEQLALVASNKTMIAQLKIPERDAQHIAIGHPAEINTRSALVRGVVNRIDPVITNGSVIIDIDITGALPVNARPELKVEGIIEIGILNNALYVKHPVGVKANSSTQLFTLLAGQQTATLRTMKFGRVIGNNIELLSGASEGEQFIVSDTSSWLSNHTLTITD